MTTAVPQPKCPWCNSTTHSLLQCPRVRAVEFREGSLSMEVARVEFVPTAEQLEFIERCEKMIEEVRATMDKLAGLQLVKRQQDG